MLRFLLAFQTFSMPRKHFIAMFVLAQFNVTPNLTNCLIPHQIYTFGTYTIFFFFANGNFSMKLLPCILFSWWVCVHEIYNVTTNSLNVFLLKYFIHFFSLLYHRSGNSFNVDFLKDPFASEWRKNKNKICICMSRSN